MRRPIVVLALLAAALASLPASADRGAPRVRFGVVIGAPFWYAPWYYGPPYDPYYDGRPAVVVRSEPGVYIEKDPQGTDLDATQYWYFCPDSSSYYPYVKSCATPWHRVVPHTPPQ